MSVISLPGLYDVHVHLRDPGATSKEDFSTGTQAALMGGFVMVIDMPNNPLPTISMVALEEKRGLADQKSECEVGFHYGTNGKNTSSFLAAMESDDVFGLKLYCNHTTGEMLIEDLNLLEEVFAAWESNKPILVHAEGVQLAAALGLAQVYERRLHVCHISNREEVELVSQAKLRGFEISAGVCPHHLFLIDKTVAKLGAYGIMKPPIGTLQDQKALWKGVREGVIDVVETDHAPHTKKEKQAKVPPFGVPGLETALPLMYKAVDENQIDEEMILQLLHKNPRKIFDLPNIESKVVLRTGKFVIGADGYKTKCGWSPFDGWEVPVRVDQVVVKGDLLIKNGKILRRDTI